MASLPSVAINGTLKLDSDLRKQSPPLFQSSNVSYQRNRTDGGGVGFEPVSMDFREALSSMRDGSSSDSSHYTALLQQCIDNHSSSETQMVHAHVIKTGFYEDPFVSTFLVNVYAKCGALGKARQVFEELPRRNVVAWTMLMTGYVQRSKPELALRVFQEMLLDGTYPTNYTLGIALSACNSLQLVGTSEQVHGYVVKYCIDHDTSIGNSLCSLYSKFRRLGSAVKAFEQIEEKNVISWTAAITACGDNGDAFMGLGFFEEMLSEGVEPNVFTLTSVLSLCCVTLCLGLGRQVHTMIIKLGIESNIPVRNSMMYLYLKTGKIQEARKLFDGMAVNSLVTWNAMIAGHAQKMELEGDDLLAYQSGNEALRIFQKLNRSGMKPDLFTFSSILTVCGSLVALEQGEQFHAQTIKSGFRSDVVVGTSLINMYNKCGSLNKASKAFVEMSTRTLISWTSMITSFAQHGKTQQALNLFEDMRFAGIRPNHVTFVGVLSACSHAGMVDQALNYFEMMQKEFRIKPVMDHYACMIDMYVRLGRLDEAFDLVKTMEFKPSQFIWSNLVAGCRSHGKLELGFYAAEKLLELKPKDAEPYVLLLNMYISSGKWQDVSRVRKMMREGGLGNVKDWSWITIKEKVYSFKPNDKSNHQSSDLHAYLEILANQAKDLGYQQLEDLDEVTDEDEVNTSTTSSSASYHSEKLVIAFGLLNTPNSTPIRVKKNFIMCKDCHNFIKTISVLTDREIAVRDSKRLHKIVNGKCSCGDFGSLL